MNCTSVLTTKEVDELLLELGLEPNNSKTNDEEYISFWDFGKEPDKTISGVSINANLSLLF